MTDPQHPDLDRPSLQAALLLLVRDLLPDGSDAPRSVSEILEFTGARKSQAYEVRSRLQEVLPTLFSSAGRPPEAPPEPKTTGAALAAVRDYLMAHPGAVCGPGMRRVYSHGFRRFVVGLAAPGQPGERLSVTELAEVTGVPLGTLKDWLRIPSERRSSPTTQDDPQPAPNTDEPPPPRL